MAKRKPTDYDSLYAKLRAANQPQPDLSKGMTAGEWAEKFGVARCTAALRLKLGVKAGLMIQETDYRPTENGTMAKTAVYREVENNATPRREHRDRR